MEVENPRPCHPLPCLFRGVYHKLPHAHKARHLRREAQLLPRNGDQLSEKVGELQRSLVKQKELTMS